MMLENTINGNSCRRNYTSSDAAIYFISIITRSRSRQNKQFLSELGWPACPHFLALFSWRHSHILLCHSKKYMEGSHEFCCWEQYNKFALCWDFEYYADRHNPYYQRSLIEQSNHGTESQIVSLIASVHTQGSESPYLCPCAISIRKEANHKI